MLDAMKIFDGSDVVGDLIELWGALILAREVWDRPQDLIDKKSVERLAKHQPVVGNTTIRSAQDIERFFAWKSAKKARLGFFLVACGLLLKAGYHSFLFFR